MPQLVRRDPEAAQPGGFHGRVEHAVPEVRIPQRPTLGRREHQRVGRAAVRQIPQLFGERTGEWHRAFLVVLHRSEGEFTADVGVVLHDPDAAGVDVQASRCDRGRLGPPDTAVAEHEHQEPVLPCGIGQPLKLLVRQVHMLVVLGQARQLVLGGWVGGDPSRLYGPLHHHAEDPVDLRDPGRAQDLAPLAGLGHQHVDPLGHVTPLNRADLPVTPPRDHVAIEEFAVIVLRRPALPAQRSEPLLGHDLEGRLRRLRITVRAQVQPTRDGVLLRLGLRQLREDLRLRLVVGPVPADRHRPGGFRLLPSVFASRHRCMAIW